MRVSQSAYSCGTNTKGKTHDAGKDLFEALSGTGGLGFSAVETVLEFKERLADRVGEGDAGGIDKGDGANSPALSQVSGRETRRAWGERTMSVRAT